MPKPTLFDHPKFHRLVHILELPEPYVLGHLEFLWRVGYSSGNPMVGDALDIEIAAKWAGERGKLSAALVAVGFVDERDGKFLIHDLHENAPNYVTHRNARENERRKPKVCGACGVTFYASDARSMFCSNACKQTSWRGRNRRDRNALRNKTERYRTSAPAHAPTHVQKIKTVTATAAPADLQALWNERVTAPIPACQELSSGRVRSATARLRERPLAEWGTVVDRIAASDFCRGQNDRSWVATFDWFLKPDTAVKALEGKYDNRGQPAGSGYQPTENAADALRARMGVVK